MNSEEVKVSPNTARATVQSTTTEPRTGIATGRGRNDEHTSTTSFGTYRVASTASGVHQTNRVNTKIGFQPTNLEACYGTNDSVKQRMLSNKNFRTNPTYTYLGLNLKSENLLRQRTTDPVKSAVRTLSCPTNDISKWDAYGFHGNKLYSRREQDTSRCNSSEFESQGKIMRNDRKTDSATVFSSNDVRSSSLVPMNGSAGIQAESIATPVIEVLKTPTTSMLSGNPQVNPARSKKGINFTNSTLNISKNKFNFFENFR